MWRFGKKPEEYTCVGCKAKGFRYTQRRQFCSGMCMQRKRRKVRKEYKEYADRMTAKLLKGRNYEI